MPSSPVLFGCDDIERTHRELTARGVRFVTAPRRMPFGTNAKTIPSKREEPKMNTPPTVSPQQWEAAREELRVKEKELMRAGDALAAERRRMPWMAAEKDYRSLERIREPEFDLLAPWIAGPDRRCCA